MYKYIPPKRRSGFRVKLGCVFYTLVRYFLFLRYSFCFAKTNKKYQKNINLAVKDYPYSVFTHSSPLYRNLSKEDTKLQEGKVHNINLAIKKLNCTVIKPGLFFSYWKLIGNPVKHKGYKKGMMLVNGKPSEATGGGLCALSNLIYWMSLHSPLIVKERYRHSYDVFPDSNRTLPFGSGATCVYNYRDLILKNQGDNEFIFIFKIENKRLCGEIRSKNPVEEAYEVYQKDHWITSEAPGVFVRHNTIYRKTFDKNHNLKKDELITENHALMMYNPYIQDKTGENKKNENTKSKTGGSLTKDKNA